MSIFHKKFKKQKNNAFTLAEVLITLTIIGVIAAMTIPTLMSKYEKHVYSVKLRNMYSNIANNLKIAFTKSNCTDFYCYYSENMQEKTSLNEKTTVIMNDLFPGAKRLGQNYNDFIYFYDLNNNKLNFFDAFGAQQHDFWQLSTGEVVSIWRYPWSNTEICTTPWNTVDWCDDYILYLDGNKKPPVLGRNLFRFAVMADGQLKPKAVYNGTNCNPGITGSGLNGDGCLSKMLQNGWKMDY